MQPLSPFPWFDAATILVLIAINGVFAMSELAIVSARAAKLKAMADSGTRGANTALRLARYFGGDAQSWLNLQSAFELRTAEIADAKRIAREIPPRAA